MSDKILHAIDIKKVISYALVGITIGAILTFVPMSSLVGIVMVIIGLLMIITSGYRVYVSVNKSENNNEMLLDCINVLMGFLLIVANNLIITIIVSIYLVVKPILLVVISKWNKEVMMNELPKILLGVILIVSGLSTFDILFKILGIVVLVLSVGYLGYNYMLYKKSGVKIIEK